MASRARNAYASGVGYRLLADLTMLVHFTFLAFVVFGGFLAWNWPRPWESRVSLIAWTGCGRGGSAPHLSLT